MHYANLSESQAKALVWVGTALAVIWTLARGIIRWKQQQKFHSDDLWAFSSTIFLLATAIQFDLMIPGLYQAQLLNGGQKITMPFDEYLQQATLYLKLEVTAMVTFWSGLWSVKLSFLMLIWRLLEGRPDYKRWWWCVLTYVILMYIGDMLCNFLACVPLYRRWDLTPQGYGKPCGNASVGLIIQGIAVAFDISSDLAIMILPLKILSGLQLSPARRLAIQAMFALSSFIVIVAIVRCALTTTGGATNFDQELWLAWTWAEGWVAVMVVNIPPFKTSFGKIWDRAATRFSTRNSKLSGRTRSDRSKSGHEMELRVPSAKVQGRRSSMDSETALTSHGNPGYVHHPPGRHGRGRHARHPTDILVTSEFEIAHDA